MSAINQSPTVVKPLLVTLKEGQSAVRCGPDKFRQMIRSGEIPVVRVDGRILVPYAALEAWVARKTETRAQAVPA
jgi:excisionase family DNA binding protein